MGITGIVKNIISLFNFFKKTKRHIFPNLDEINRRISDLDKDIDRLWDMFVALYQDNKVLHDNIVRMEERYSNFNRVISLQNQLVQILLDLIDKK
jgi:regulator of replication initiation timing